MNSLPEQFSAARQAQLDDGLNLMRSLSDQALDRTSRVFALQLDASRAAVEQSSNAMRQLLTANDPRDLLAIGSQSQQHLRTMLDYGRELFSIAAAGMNVPLQGTSGVDTPAPHFPAAIATAAPGTTLAKAAEAVVEQAAAPVADAAAKLADAAADVRETAAAGFGPLAEAPVEASFDAVSAAAPLSVVTSDVEPDAERTVIARATSEALDTLDSPPHPVAASVPVEVAVEIDMPKIEPVDATPPAAATSAGPSERRGKGRKKQG